MSSQGLHGPWGSSGLVCSPVLWWPGGSGCGQGGAEFLWLENEHKRTNIEGCTMLIRHSPGLCHGAVAHYHCLSPGREQRGAWRLMAELIAQGSAGSSPPWSPNSHYNSGAEVGARGCTSLLDRKNVIDASLKSSLGALAHRGRTRSFSSSPTFFRNPRANPACRLACDLACFRMHITIWFFLNLSIPKCTPGVQAGVSFASFSWRNGPEHFLYEQAQP